MIENEKHESEGIAHHASLIGLDRRHQRSGRNPARGVLLMLVLCLNAKAQDNGKKLEKSAPAPVLTGLWELLEDKNVPPAALIPGPATQREAIYRHDLLALRWCHFVGMPRMMEGAPLDILQGSDGKEIVIVSQSQGVPRHIYVDGRKHPDSKIYDPTTMGNSIAHWEGETLIVDTTGFNDQGISSIPGGGIRTHDSHLIERYRLVENGQALSVVFRWDDPNVFQKPHIYEYRYYRAPKGVEQRQFQCNSGDEDRAKFLTSDPTSESH